MTDDQARKDFFISYTGADRSWAEWMAWQLEQANYSVILQAWDFHPGGNFVLDMDQASRQCERTITVLSADYFKSKYTPSEWAAAFRQDPLSQQKLLLPVRVDDCDIEGLLGQIVYIDLVGKDEQAARLALLAGVSSERAKPATAPAFPVTTPSSATSPAFPGVLPAIWTVPSLRNPFFTGREEPLEQLAKAFEGRGAARMREPIALSGLGGIGKTQIAIEYAYRFSTRYQTVLWARAGSRDTLIADYVSFVPLLGLPQTQEAEQLLLVRVVKQWLASHAGWLLMLDNADDLALAREFLPPSSAGHVLLTTRAEVTAPLARCIAIEVLSTGVGAHFLLQRAGLLALELPLEQASLADQALARQLCDEMGGLPLALDQAGAYIRENACRLSDYLEWYRERRTILLRERGSLGDEHPEPVATTWSLSFDQVEHKSAAAADLLRLCAFLHPDAIPLELITEGTADLGPPLEPLGTDPLALNAALKELRAYSLVHRDPDTQSLSLHRLVQAVLKDSMKEQTRLEWAERTVRAVNRVFPEVDVTTWHRCEQYLPHAQNCKNLIDHHKFVFLEAGRLLYETGRYLHARALNEQAEPLFQKALEIRKQVLGVKNRDTADTLQDLAWLYLDQGKYEKAAPLYRRAFYIRCKELGARDPKTAYTLQCLARVYKEQDQYKQAEPLLKNAEEILKQVSGVKEDANTACILHYLAWFYKYISQYTQSTQLVYAEKSEKLFLQALEIREKKLGAEHRDTASTLHDLAWLNQDQGKYKLALQHFLKAKKIRERVLGAEHRDTASTLHALAWLYYTQCKYEKAEPLFQKALEIRKQVLGAEHPDTASTLNDLARLYFTQGKYEQADPHFQKALEIREQQLGPEHPDTATSLINLAGLYMAQGKYKQAELLYQRALVINEQVFGPEHPNTTTVREKYNALVKDMKQREKGNTDASSQ